MAGNDHPQDPSSPKRRRIVDDDTDNVDESKEESADNNQNRNNNDDSQNETEEERETSLFSQQTNRQQQQEQQSQEQESQSQSKQSQQSQPQRQQKLSQRQQERLRREVEDLRTTFYPGDANYNEKGLHRTTSIEDENEHDNAENDNDSYNPDTDNEDVDFHVNRNNNDADVDADVDVNVDYNPEEEELEGEDLLDNQFQDYQRIEALDTYGTEGIDDREYDPMDAEQRDAADRIVAQRQRERRNAAAAASGRSGRFYRDLDMDMDDEDFDARKSRYARFRTKGRGGKSHDDETDVDGYHDDENAYDENGNPIDPDRLTQEEEDDDDDEVDEDVNLEAFDVPLREWIAQDRTRREIQRKFRNFLKTFQIDDYDNPEQEQNGEQPKLNGNKNPKKSFTPKLYEERIRTMCSSNNATLEISYLHLMQKEPILAIWLADVPKDLLDVINEAATRHTLKLFPSYAAIQDEIHIRVTDMPILDSLRSLRRTHLDKLVKVHGVVTRRSSIYPQLKLAYYDCIKCKHTLGPYKIDESNTNTTASNSNTANNNTNLPSSNNANATASNAASSSFVPSTCPHCESEGPFRLNPTQTQYRNFQRVNLQETPGSVPPGRVPRTKEVLLSNDLIDIARPGEEVEITGIFSHSYDYHLTQKSGFPVFSTYLSANHIRRREDASAAANLTEADKAQILQLAKDPKIGERILLSIAPSIYGHKHVKMALAMSLFGAVPKNISDKHRIRGDINVLLLGDPGTAKSQMLKYAEGTAPRAVYSTGKGASAVGLTASVHKDPITREWTLEGGALVLADRGICLIDEFDKMNEQDRTSIHEAMEQQSISVSKAGIVTSLQARCAVIAAANPIGGRYDSSCTFSENVELTDPILQRFDVLCVLQDTIDPVADERLAKFVTTSHMKSIPTSDLHRNHISPRHTDDLDETTTSTQLQPISQDLLRKYIQYARTNVKPVLRNNTFDQQKIASLYVALRRESASSGGVPIAVRHIESIMRMAEAHAKMHLREHVRDDDMDASITMMLESFITAQKFSVRRQLRRNFAKYVNTGEDRAHLLLHILQDMMRNEAIYQTIRLRQRGRTEDSLGTLEIPLEEFESRARDRRIYDVSEFCQGQDFTDAGYIFDKSRGLITRDPNLDSSL